MLLFEMGWRKARAGNFRWSRRVGMRAPGMVGQRPGGTNAVWKVGKHFTSSVHATPAFHPFRPWDSVCFGLVMKPIRLDKLRSDTMR